MPIVVFNKCPRFAVIVVLTTIKANLPYNKSSA